MKTHLRFILNGKETEARIPAATTVLDLLRREFELFGTKEGCREGECGACTVILGRLSEEGVSYGAVPSCLLPGAQINGCHVVTIEGLDTGSCNPLQQAFVDQGATQCGFCTPGFIMALTGHFLSGAKINMESAASSVDGNICRCTGYESIRRAIAQTVSSCGLTGTQGDTAHLIEQGLIPPYFADIPEKLLEMQHRQAQEDPADSADDSLPIIAGGTDLFVQQGDALTEKPLRFLIPGSDPIVKTEEGFVIPGTATMEQLRNHTGLNTAFPGLGEKLLTVASSILRNRATIAGNIMNASPIADTAVLLLAWEATVHLKNRKTGKTRKILLENLYKGYKDLDVSPGEIISVFSIPYPKGSWGFNKVSKREHLDIASCNSALKVVTQDSVVKEFRLGVGGVAPYPLLAKKTAEFVRGKAVSRQILIDSLKILASEIAPIDDVRGSAEYKSRLAVRLLADHYLSIFPHILTYDLLKEGGLS